MHIIKVLKNQQNMFKVSKVKSTVLRQSVILHCLIIKTDACVESVNSILMWYLVNVELIITTLHNID